MPVDVNDLEGVVDDMMGEFDAFDKAVTDISEGNYNYEDNNGTWVGTADGIHFVGYYGSG